MYTAWKPFVDYPQANRLRFRQSAFEIDPRDALAGGEQMRFEECRSRALECLRLAYEAKDVNTRAEWVNTAEQWLQRADKVQRIEMSRQERLRRTAQVIPLQRDYELVISWKDLRTIEETLAIRSSSS
jgi:hypothetical protein